MEQTPNMDNAFAVFTTWQTIALGLTVYVITAIIRRILETGNPNIRYNRWWRNVFLPLAPVGNAILLAVFLRDFPWPEPVQVSVSTRVMYALVCGIVCGWVYSRVRKFIRDPQPTAEHGMGGAMVGGMMDSVVGETPQQGDFLTEPENGIFEAGPSEMIEPPRPRKRRRRKKHEDQDTMEPVSENEEPPRKRRKRRKAEACSDPECPLTENES